MQRYTGKHSLTHSSQWHPPDVSCQSLRPAPSPHSCCYAVFETMVTVKVPVGSVSLRMHVPGLWMHSERLPVTHLCKSICCDYYSVCTLFYIYTLHTCTFEILGIANIYRSLNRTISHWTGLVLACVTCHLRVTYLLCVPTDV